MNKLQTANKSDMFASVEQRLCPCGCGQTFFVSGKGKKRIYVNDTHKKRAARKLKKERQNSDRARLTPKGWLYLQAADQETLDDMFAQFNGVEQALIKLVCETGYTPADIAVAGSNLWEWTYLFKSDRAGK